MVRLVSWGLLHTDTTKYVVAMTTAKAGNKICKFFVCPSLFLQLSITSECN